MFCITIKFKNEPSAWMLMFQKEETAEYAFKQLYSGSPSISISDDYGQAASVEKSCIAGAMLEDLDKSMLAHVERGLHNARTQAKYQQQAMSDPVLKTAAMTRGGPALFDPQGGNGFAHR